VNGTRRFSTVSQVVAEKAYTLDKSTTAGNVYFQPYSMIASTYTDTRHISREVIHAVAYAILNTLAKSFCSVGL
jgi:hypothetical protein